MDREPAALARVPFLGLLVHLETDLIQFGPTDISGMPTVSPIACCTISPTPGRCGEDTAREQRCPGAGPAPSSSVLLVLAAKRRPFLSVSWAVLSPLSWPRVLPL